MRFGTALVAATLTAAAAPLAPALAADMPSYYSPAGSYTPPDQPLEFGAGWYLRGDASFGPEDKPKLLLRDTAPTFSRQGSTFGYGFGGGAGYKFNDWFRVDVTADYLDPFRYTGTTSCGQSCTRQERSTLWRWDGLVNGYVDLGTWAGITPYIGAGAGFAGTHSQDVNTINGLPTNAKIPSHTDYQFAWAAMAGVTYAFAPHMLFDLGYRYLDLGKTTIALVPSATVTRTITEQQVRLGVRYMID